MDAGRRLARAHETRPVVMEGQGRVVSGQRYASRRAFGVATALGESGDHDLAALRPPRVIAYRAPPLAVKRMSLGVNGFCLPR
jgi:hypothetical protein